MSEFTRHGETDCGHWNCLVCEPLRDEYWTDERLVKVIDAIVDDVGRELSD
ncbi:MAG TPA: hypothetical protein VM782_01260 [Stellaceae bacterium]|nr:hypothetical protein [Stellaceae bacterium]